MSPNPGLPLSRTKIVCTIGPASSEPETMRQMLLAGMGVARLNFSHGDFETHAATLDRLRKASDDTGRRLAILADLPGPKIRIGTLDPEPVELAIGDPFTLTTIDLVGGQSRASVSFEPLPRVVKPGDCLYLNDGLVQLEVEHVTGDDVICKTLVGGTLRSRKGLNLPGIDLGIRAFTDHDRECLEFAMGLGVDAVSQSFVETADDLRAVREAANAAGGAPFLIAKIERSGALANLDEILEEADGIMIARGDLGVEIPIQRIATVQKDIMRRANRLGRPVITATQMLESMTSSRLPTRAEATDVANAILDGTDCVMLSGESAMGKYPVDAVRMLAGIAANVEMHREPLPVNNLVDFAASEEDTSVDDLLSLGVEAVFAGSDPVAVVVQSRSGATARSITRFRLPVWVHAVSACESTCQQLQFSYGVCPIHVPELPGDAEAFACELLRARGHKEGVAVLAAAPDNGVARMGIVRLAD